MAQHYADLTYRDAVRLTAKLQATIQRLIQLQTPFENRSNYDLGGQGVPISTTVNGEFDDAVDAGLIVRCEVETGWVSGIPYQVWYQELAQSRNFVSDVNALIPDYYDQLREAEWVDFFATLASLGVEGILSRIGVAAVAERSISSGLSIGSRSIASRIQGLGVILRRFTASPATRRLLEAEIRTARTLLIQSESKAMLREARQHLLNAGLNQEIRAENFRDYIRQIHSVHRDWNAVEYVGTEGSVVFTGPTRIMVIDPLGGIWSGPPNAVEVVHQLPIRGGAGNSTFGTATPNYHGLEQL